MLNAKTRELMELQAMAQKRLAETRANFLDGMRVAKQVKGDLEWLQKKTEYVFLLLISLIYESMLMIVCSALKAKAEQRYPVEYNMARERYPGPADYEY